MSKSRRLQLVAVLVVCLILAVVASFSSIKLKLTTYRLHSCMQDKEYRRCIALIEGLKINQPLPSELRTALRAALSAYTQSVPLYEAIQYVRQLYVRLPHEELIKEHLIGLEIAQIQALDSSAGESMAEHGLKLSEIYANNASVQFTLAKILWEKAPNLLPPIIAILTRAIKLDQSYAKEAVSSAIVSKALAEIPRGMSDTTCALVENYFLEGMTPALRENLNKRETIILRNNSYQILKSANQVTADDTFLHHWLNLLSGSSETTEDFNEATEYFESLDQGAAVIDKASLSKKLDFSYFPNIDKIADYYLHETLKLLMKIFPEPTHVMLVKNLKEKKSHWRRVNSFYTLKDNDGLNKTLIANYHDLNLSLPDYEYFTDWLSDSIDYFAKEKAFEKLKEFATRIRALKQSRNQSKEQELVVTYTQIENYVRNKIGKRN